MSGLELHELSHASRYACRMCSFILVGEAAEVSQLILGLTAILICAVLFTLGLISMPLCVGVLCGVVMAELVHFDVLPLKHEIQSFEESLADLDAVRWCKTFSDADRMLTDVADLRSRAPSSHFSDTGNLNPAEITRELQNRDKDAPETESTPLI